MLFTFQPAVLRCGFLSRQSNSYGQENNTIFHPFAYHLQLASKWFTSLLNPFIIFLNEYKHIQKQNPTEREHDSTRKKGSWAKRIKCGSKIKFHRTIAQGQSAGGGTCLINHRFHFGTVSRRSLAAPLRQTLLRYLCNKPLANCFSFFFCLTNTTRIVDIMDID